MEGLHDLGARPEELDPIRMLRHRALDPSLTAEGARVANSAALHLDIMERGGDEDGYESALDML